MLCSGAITCPEDRWPFFLWRRTIASCRRHRRYGVSCQLSAELWTTGRCPLGPNCLESRLCVLLTCGCPEVVGPVEHNGIYFCHQ